MRPKYFYLSPPHPTPSRPLFFPPPRPVLYRSGTFKGTGLNRQGGTKAGRDKAQTSLTEPKTFRSIKKSLAQPGSTPSTTPHHLLPCIILRPGSICPMGELNSLPRFKFHRGDQMFCAKFYVKTGLQSRRTLFLFLLTGN